MRTTSEVLIYIDMEGAIAAGLPFEISANNVVLSPGNPQGYIPTSFFKAVLDAKTKAPFDPEFPNPL
jgi:2'-phosphotransferase